MTDIDTRVTGTKAFLGDVKVGMRIAFEDGRLDLSGDEPTVVYDVIQGVVTSLDHIAAVPHAFIEFAIDNGEARRSRADRKVVIV